MVPGDALNVGWRDGRDAPAKGGELVDRQPVEVDLGEPGGQCLGRLQAQWELSAEIGLRLVERLPVRGMVPEVALDGECQLERFGRRRVLAEGADPEVTAREAGREQTPGDVKPPPRMVLATWAGR